MHSYNNGAPTLSISIIYDIWNIFRTIYKYVHICKNTNNVLTTKMYQQ